ncbi:MAG TPA: BglII/BstYI family type II restriction endonuclease [Actinomycetes bacterium]|nr:BglII/BstYI family type II restriction endonuclease [Actinomycetes bacterium]
MFDFEVATPEVSIDQLAATEPAGAVLPATIDDLPAGYTYGVTRYADIILRHAFSKQFDDLMSALSQFTIHLQELRAGGGGRTVFVRRFDDSLAERGWGKKNIEIGKTIDGEVISAVRGHEIDMFSTGSKDKPYPGVAVEMEWNNKDPFYDRDLLNYQALHREGALAVGVIVTRGATLQRLLERTLLNDESRTSKYGKASTHWDKLLPRVGLGGGGECPLLLIGIEPARIEDRDVLIEADLMFDEADEFRASWRNTYRSWSEAEPQWLALMKRGYDILDRSPH